MWQNIIILVIVLLCIVYIGRKFFRQARGQAGCGCGCNGCTPPAAGDSGTPRGDAGSCGCGERQ